MTKNKVNYKRKLTKITNGIQTNGTINHANNALQRATKKKQIVDLWVSQGGHITQLCEIVGIARVTFYQWVKQDKDFAQALVNQEASITDDVKDTLLQLIQEKNLGAVIFWLKNKSPEFTERGNQTNIQVNFIDTASKQSKTYNI